MKLNELSMEQRVNRKLQQAATALRSRLEPQPSRLSLLWRIWRLSRAVPGLRLGQLLANAIEVGGSRRDTVTSERLFYIADAELSRRLDGFTDYIKGVKSGS
jgi:hypothetical protein